MDREDIRKYQLAQLALLKQVDSICNKLQLKYYLVYGTLIGAVRHNGFIPWDADVDVALFRDDYEKLKEFFCKQPIENLFYQHYETDANHILPHAVLRIEGTHVIYNYQRSSRYKSKHDGIYIDIFPIDNLTNDEKLRKTQARKYILCRRIIELKAAPIYGDKTSIIKKVTKAFVSIILSPISFRYLNEKADNYMKMYNNEESEYVVIFTNPRNLERYSFPKEYFGTPKEVLFEGELFPAPQDTNAFLSIHYGDYMKLPPETERWGYLDEAIDHVEYGNLENTVLC